MRVCLITLGKETFAVDIRQVCEVFEPEGITPVPGMPAVLVGVGNLRGIIIPLVDLRPALGVSNSTRPRYAAVVRHGAQQVGLLIEEIPEIHTIQMDLVVPSIRTDGGQPALFSRSFATANKFCALLEVSRLLAFIEKAIDDRNHNVKSQNECVITTDTAYLPE
jgi:purine-binding chemotaxis protein CheW